MRRIGVLVACSVVGVVLFACNLPQPSPDSTATEIAAEIYATQTAAAVTPTPPSTSVPVPSPTPPPMSPSNSSGYYPMAVGDYWVLRFTLQDGSTWQRRREVTSTRQMDGGSVFIVRVRSSWADPGTYSDRYISINGGDVYWHGTDRYEAGTLVETKRPVAGPLLELHLPFQAGDETQTIQDSEVTDHEGNTRTRREVFHDVVEALESISVPAGNFEDCWRIRETWTSDDGVDANLIWHCPGIGLAKMLVVESSEETAIGLLLELLEYRVN